MKPDMYRPTQDNTRLYRVSSRWGEVYVRASSTAEALDKAAKKLCVPRQVFEEWATAFPTGK